MQSQFAAFAQQQAKAALDASPVLQRSGSLPACFFCSLLRRCSPRYSSGWNRCTGRPIAAVIVAAVAFVLGLLATLPLMVGRRERSRAPAPASDATLPQVVSLLAQGASALGPKQSALTAVVLAVALGLMARGSCRGQEVTMRLPTETDFDSGQDPPALSRRTTGGLRRPTRRNSSRRSSALRRRP